MYSPNGVFDTQQHEMESQKFTETFTHNVQKTLLMQPDPLGALQTKKPMAVVFVPIKGAPVPDVIGFSWSLNASNQVQITLLTSAGASSTIAGEVYVMRKR